MLLKSSWCSNIYIFCLKFNTKIVENSLNFWININWVIFWRHRVFEHSITSVLVHFFSLFIFCFLLLIRYKFHINFIMFKVISLHVFSICMLIPYLSIPCCPIFYTRWKDSQPNKKIVIFFPQAKLDWFSQIFSC
jgi:membrane-bound metal-dependent hydrolase YbcI (DUF457 family)